MHFTSFEVVSVKDLKLCKGHLSFLWTLTKAGKWYKLPQPKWHHVISVLQAAASQKCYHMTRIFEPRTKTNGPWSELKKSTCPPTSEMDRILPAWKMGREPKEKFVGDLLLSNSTETFAMLATQQGVKLTSFPGSHLAPKYFKVVANSKKLVVIMTHTQTIFTLSLYRID